MLNKLFQRKGEIVSKMRALLDTAAKANRDLTAEESTAYTAMESDLGSVEIAIKREQSVAAHEASVAGFRDSGFRPGITEQREDGVGRASAGYRGAFFNGYVRRGINGMTPDHSNALQEGTNSEGGYIVPQEFERAIYASLVEMDLIRAAATVIQTSSDRNIPIEASKGTFAYIDEEGAYSESDPAFGRLILGAHKFGGIVKVSEELLQDASFDLEAYLRGLAAERTSILEATSFCTGDNTGKPNGLFNVTAVGGVNITNVAGAVSATAAITGDNLIDVYHSISAAYRKNASWLMGDAMVKLIRKLKSNDNQYLWQPGLAEGQPDRLMGRPLISSTGGPAPAVSTKTIVFGDLKKYVIVDRLGITMQRLNELYAANGQIGFKFTGRHDAELTDAKAIATFTHGAAS